MQDNQPWSYMFGKRKKKQKPAVIETANAAVIIVETIDTDMVYERIQSDYYRSKLPYASKKEDEAVWQAYREDDGRLNQLFREHALEAVGLKNSPNADAIWAKAWSDGHAYGFNEVFLHLQDYADLVAGLTCPHCNKKYGDKHA